MPHTQGVALGYGDIGLSARIVWVLTYPHRLPLIYKDKYDHILIDKKLTIEVYTVMNTAEVQQTLAFAAMCVDATAKAEGCSRREMYRRLRDVGLMHGLTTRLDPLHTQSKEYVVDDLLTALHRLEAGN